MPSGLKRYYGDRDFYFITLAYGEDPLYAQEPLKRGLVDSPDQWPWSSWRAYAYRENGVVSVFTNLGADR